MEPLAIGFFLTTVGYIVGLGAVTVIDTLGFLGRTSSYWTVATIRAHKVTKPLIITGMMLKLVGDIMLSGHWTFMKYLLLADVLLLINGAFLVFSVSPYLLQKEREHKDHELLPAWLQVRIAISFVISAILWWGSICYFLLNIYAVL